MLTNEEIEIYLLLLLHRTESICIADLQQLLTPLLGEEAEHRARLIWELYQPQSPTLIDELSTPVLDRPKT